MIPLSVDSITSMLREHWFWGVMTLACLVWYCTITIYVSIKGVRDIRKMFRDLASRNAQEKNR